MADLNPTGAGGTTSADGADPGRAQRAKDWFTKNPASPSGPAPAGAVVLDRRDDAATAAAKMMGANSSQFDADLLSQVGTTWSGIRDRVDNPLTREAAFDEAVALIGELRADAAADEASAGELEQQTLDSLRQYDDPALDGLESEAKRALYDALLKLPAETVGKVFENLASRIGELQNFEGQRLVAIIKLRQAGALQLPNYNWDVGVTSLIAKSPNRVHIEAMRTRAELLGRMAGSVEAATMKRAEATGHGDALRDQLGLSALQPGRVGKPDGPRAIVLDVPASERDLARWGRSDR